MFIIFTIALLALALGTMLVLMAKKNSAGMAVFIGYFVGILAFLVVIFSGYFAVKQTAMVMMQKPAQAPAAQVVKIRRKR